MLALLCVILLSITSFQCSGTTIRECTGGKFFIDRHTVNLTCEGVSNSLFWDFTFVTGATAFEYDCTWSPDTCRDEDGGWYAVTRPDYTTSTLTLRVVKGPRIEGRVICGARDAINDAAQCEVRLDSTLNVKTTTPSTTTVKTQTPSTPEPRTTPKPPPPSTKISTEKRTTSTTTTQPTSAPRTTSQPYPSPPTTTTKTEKQSTDGGVIATTKTPENNASSDDDNDGLPLVAIAAGAGGGLLLLIIIIVIIIVLMRRRRGSSDVKSKADDDDFVEHINLLYESSDAPHAYARPPLTFLVLTNHNMTTNPREARRTAEDEGEDSFAGYSSVAQQPNSEPGQEDKGSTNPHANVNGKGGNSAEAGGMFSPDPAAPENSTDVYAVVNKPKSRAKPQPGTQSDVYENVTK